MTRTNEEIRWVNCMSTGGPGGEWMGQQNAQLLLFRSQLGSRLQPRVSTASQDCLENQILPHNQCLMLEHHDRREEVQLLAWFLVTYCLSMIIIDCVHFDLDLTDLLSLPKKVKLLFLCCPFIAWPSEPARCSVQTMMLFCRVSHSVFEIFLALIIDFSSHFGSFTLTTKFKYLLTNIWC